MGILLSGAEQDQPRIAEELEQKKALLLLAEGFEDAEAICALDVMGWTRYRPSIATVSIEITGLRERVHGAFGTTFDIDIAIEDIKPERYDALIIPGGFHNLGYDEAYDERVRSIARTMHEQGKPIATMCVGVLPVAEAGLLEGGRAATYALSSRHDNPGRLRDLGCEAVDEPVVEWSDIISCSGPAHSEQVMQLLLERLVGTQAAQEVARFRSGMAK